MSRCNESLFVLGREYFFFGNKMKLLLQLVLTYDKLGLIVKRRTIQNPYCHKVVAVKAVVLIIVFCHVFSSYVVCIRSLLSKTDN